MADGAVRAITHFLRWGQRRADVVSAPAADVPPARVLPTRAFGGFLAALAAREAPVLLDLGPVVGPNINFFGERLGCKILVEDLFADVERHRRAGRAGELTGFFEARLPQADASVDGILCWDLLDYLEREPAQSLARTCARLLRPGGALLGFFATTASSRAEYTKYVIRDEQQLEHRPYAATGGRVQVLQNRDILRLFEDLQVSDSFLLKSHIREVLFRRR